MVPWVSPAWQGPWPSKEGPLGAGGQHCCGVAEARVDSLSGLMCDPGPWAGQGKQWEASRDSTVYGGGSQVPVSGSGSAMIKETKVDAGYVLFYTCILTSVFYPGQNVYLTRTET